MNKKSKAYKRGISLIVLVITIIVIVILAVAVILSIANNNPIEQAKRAKFQNDLKTMEEELNMYIASQVSDIDEDFEIEDLNEKGQRVKSIIKSATNEWINKIEIVKGKLVFVGEDDIQIEWANQVLSIKTKKSDSTTDKVKLVDSAVSSIKGFKIYGNTEQIDGENISVGNAVADEDKYKITITLSGKNLLRFDKTISRENVKLTSSKSHMILNGSNNINFGNVYDWSNNIVLNPGNYTYSYNYFSGDIISVGDQAIYIGLFERTSNTWYPDDKKSLAIGLKTHKYFDYSKSKRFSFTVTEKANVSFHIVGRGEFDNLNFGVQLEEGNKHTAWEPYYKPVTYTIYLDNPLRKVGNYTDYLDLYTGTVYRYVNEVNGKLVGSNNYTTETIDISDIELHEGTNILTVNTDVAPSKMEAMYISNK